MSKQIKISFPGFEEKPNRGLKKLLENHNDIFSFDVRKDPKQADFIGITGFSNYSNVFRLCETYRDKIIIARCGEACSIDYNLIDYAIGFDEQKIGDRHFRPFITCCWLFPDWESKLSAPKDPEVIKKLATQKSRFCNFIYSNSKAHPNRDSFFRLLSEYKKVESSGKHLNNQKDELPDCKWSDKEFINFKSRYKFSIAFENATHNGYNTEKIATSMLANTIPIYWGDPDIYKYYNTKSFINCHDYDNFEQVLKKVKELDTDSTKYNEMLAEPWLTPMQCKLLAESKLKYGEWLKNIFEQPHQKAFRKPNGWMNDQYRGLLSSSLS